MTDIQTTTPNIEEFINASSDAALCYNFLKDNYKLRLNIITGNLEDANVKINGNPKLIGDREINTIYIKMISKTERKISKNLLESFIQSDFVDLYNPFIDFFTENSNYKRNQSIISELASTIHTDTLQAEKFIKHWACGMIASIFGSQSPLTLVLVGELLNTGKTEWFRRLLPKELNQYYAESSLDNGKDDDILMCRKLIIMDDEFGGKSKKDQRHFKSLTSRQNMSIRLPYGRSQLEMRRICSLCGTSNELELLSDPYGNRRILPINVLGVNHESYNQIDKTALMMAFYDLYKTGFHWKFKQNDVRELEIHSKNFEAPNPESELISQLFVCPESESDGEFMTNTAIKDYIELNTKQKIWNQTKLGIELKKAGFVQKMVKKDRQVHRMYFMKRIHEPNQSPQKEYPF